MKRLLFVGLAAAPLSLAVPPSAALESGRCGYWFATLKERKQVTTIFSGCQQTGAKDGPISAKLRKRLPFEFRGSIGPIGPFATRAEAEKKQAATIDELSQRDGVRWQAVSVAARVD